MIGGDKVLEVIPARGGSKGVPGKNIREIGGKLLISWTIDAAKSACCVDRVILTSDDADIIRVAKECGWEVPFVRAARLAQDDTTTIEVVLDALERCPGYDWVFLLQPTSPLRSADDIDEAAECCLRHDAPACISVCRAQKSPYWMYTMHADGQLEPLLPNFQFTQRQDLPPVYLCNGAIYLARTEWLRQHKKFISQSAVSYEMPVQCSIDIDSESDFQQLKIFLED